VNTIRQEIGSIRAEWGSRLLILGHHYQRSSVLHHADEKGDSLELARKAASRPEAERIVFCGVRFMAESADILSDDRQFVYMPETEAGCPMAHMSTAAQMESALTRLASVGDNWIPVVYVNSTAEVKAVCGRHGGSACTSSNAAHVLQWVFDQGKRPLFLPDEHLGANTAHDLGIPDESVAVYDPQAKEGGLKDQDVQRARIVVWKGFCLVHKAFSLEHVRHVRERIPKAQIIVHPEVPKEVVREADAHGSTAQIIRYVESAPAGSTIVIGTEQNLVERLAEQHQDRLEILALSPSICANMARTNERNLLALLRTWDKGHRIEVPVAVARDARSCLERMLEI
jgi:quinolinate synthase